MLNAYGPGGDLSNIGGPSNDSLHCSSPIYQLCSHDLNALRSHLTRCGVLG